MQFIINSNNLFYYFSTVSQTIAAFISFLGVFVVFKIQYLDGILNSLYKAIDEHTTNRLGYQFIGEINLFKKVNKIIEYNKANDRHKDTIAELRELISRYNNIRTKKQKISQKFITPTILSIFTISTSVAGILIVKISDESYQNIYLITLLIINITTLLLSIFYIYTLLKFSLLEENTTEDV